MMEDVDEEYGRMLLEKCPESFFQFDILEFCNFVKLVSILGRGCL